MKKIIFVFALLLCLGVASAGLADYLQELFFSEQPKETNQPQQQKSTLPKPVSRSAQETSSSKSKRASNSPFVDAPVRVVLPDASGNDGFDIDATSGDSLLTGDRTLFWFDSNSRRFQFSSTRTVYATHFLANSFCDIADPRTLSLAPASAIGPYAGLAVVVRTSDANGTPGYWVLWLTDESNVQAGMIVFTLQYFYGDAINTYPCFPEITRVTPTIGWSQGSMIYLEGRNFGLNPTLINIQVGPYQCTNVAYFVPQKWLKCYITGDGLNLGIGIGIGDGSVRPSRFVYSFRGDCPLDCGSGAFPDPNCSGCSLLSTPDIVLPRDTTSINLDEFAAFLMEDLVHGQRSSDVSFLSLAQSYKGTAMEAFPIPRYSIPEADAGLVMGITNVAPLQVNPITQQLENYEAGSLASFDFHLVSNDARWTKITTNETTTYRLDL